MEVDDGDRLSADTGFYVHRIVLRGRCRKAEGLQGLERVVPVEAGLEGLVDASSRVGVVAVYDGSGGDRRPEGWPGIRLLAIRIVPTRRAVAATASQMPRHGRRCHR